MARNNDDSLIPHPRVARLIGFNLQMATLRTIAMARDALADADISPARVTALALLYMNPGCHQSELGRALAINRASAMKLVNSLARQGLVERREGRDRRSKALHITPAGERVLETALPLVEEADARAARGLEGAARDDLLAALRQLG